MTRVAKQILVVLHAITMEKQLTTKQICQRLDVSMVTLKSWRDGSSVRRPLPAVAKKLGQRGKLVYVYWNDLLDWLAEYRPDLKEKLETPNGPP